MNILFATSEIFPLIKTGGLADVSFNLPLALKNCRQAIRVIIPAYKSVLEKAENIKELAAFELDGHQVQLLETHILPSRLKVWMIACAKYFDRTGSPYMDNQSQDWADNSARFGLFCKAVVAVATDQLGLKWRADIVHCNDWQTGLVPVYLQNVLQDQRPKAIFTIHNLAFQGLFPYTDFDRLGIPQHFWSPEALEYYGQLSFIKGGLVFADRITTVSPHYAQEILSEDFGCGLDGLLRSRQQQLSGILNGVDNDTWNPSTDTALIKNYTISSLSNKANNKRDLQHHCGFSISKKTMLIGVVSRLSEQKGIDLLLECLTKIEHLPIQFAVLGSGNPALELSLLEAAQAYPQTLSVTIGYDEQFAHRIIAGADVFAMPSRYEPCGLTQMYALQYGTLPLVRAVGGLADTVIDTNTVTIQNNTADGFVFDETTAEALAVTIERALRAFTDKALWQQLQKTAMQQDFSWTNSAKQYLELYAQILD